MLASIVEGTPRAGGAKIQVTISDAGLYGISTGGGTPMDAGAAYMLARQLNAGGDAAAHAWAIKAAPLPAVATPNNANAAAAGVQVGQFYTSTADPAILYVRTA
jgi:hypothetical protein